jgi:hypothetical protein
VQNRFGLEGSGEWRRCWGQGQEGEMTQTMYEHVNKWIIKKIISLNFIIKTVIEKQNIVSIVSIQWTGIFNNRFADHLFCNKQKFLLSFVDQLYLNRSSDLYVLNRTVSATTKGLMDYWLIDWLIQCLAM